LNYKELEPLIDSDPDHVAAVCTQQLDKDPDDALALFLLGTVYARAERFGLAVNVFKRVVQLKPKRPESWNNLGMAYHGLKSPVALDCFHKAWKLEKRAAYAANIASAHIEQCRWKDALEWADRSLSLGETQGAHVTRGMASLALGKWRQGWEGFNHSLGGKFRKEIQFQDEERWDGSPGKTLVVYGEQGLGDEILYSSCIPDIKGCKVILECDNRLEGLFRRSFPDVDVYGTRREPAPWLDNYTIDARCPIAGLPGFYRNAVEEFPKTPYLKADPDRVIQWKALFDSWGKRPKIGIAWSGGSRHNRPEMRAIGLESFRPLIEGMDADFISMQYKDPTEEIEATGLPVKHFKRACETDDYDDTAGLVAALDMVIGVHTSVHHLAGGLGVKSVILVPDKTLWLYAGDFPWYPATLIRQNGTWTETIRGLHDSGICRV
jgi:tetratricopeptide (TPR) repeat protein